MSFSFLFFSFKNNEFSWTKEPYFKLLSILFIYLLFSTILSIDPANSITRNFGFVRYILLIFAIKFFIKKNKNYKIIFLIWTLIILIVSLDVYYEFYSGKNLLGYHMAPESRRIVSFFKDEPIVGGFLFSFLFIILGFLFNEKSIDNKWKIFKYIIPFVVITAILLTTERSNSIKALIGMIIFIFIFKKILFKEKIIILAVFITTISSLIYFSETIKHKYYEQFFKQNKIYWAKNDLQSYLDRNLYFKHYKAGYEVFKKKPIFGVGNKNFGSACYNFIWKNQPKNQVVCSTHPHQIYFELLAEHGVVGTLIILYVIFSIVWLNIKNYFKYRNSLHFASIIYVILTFLPLLPSGSFFGNYNSTLFWINFAIMLAFEKENHITNKKV